MASLIAALVRTQEKVPQQGNAHRERRQKQVLQQSGSLLETIVHRVRLRFLSRNDCRDVLQKIDAALLARSAVPLLVGA